MHDEDFKYDVAISFVTADQGVAKELAARLSPNMRVFVYFEEQSSIAGEHGTEVFRQVFRKESRLVVVLYRAAWGSTAYTRIEERAIEERFLEEHDRFLLFVRMDDGKGMPKWAPETKIWLDFKTYGIDQVVGAVKHRAQEAGAELRVESASDRLHRSAEEARLRKVRADTLRTEGQSAFSREAEVVLQTCLASIEKARDEGDDTGIQQIREGTLLTMRGPHASVVIERYWEGRPEESRIVFRSWSGRLPFPGELRALADQTKEGRTLRFLFDFEPLSGAWGWRGEGDHETFRSADLAEHLIKLFLDIDEGERQKRERRDRRR